MKIYLEGLLRRRREGWGKGIVKVTLGRKTKGNKWD
jgi:hypothetical protein